MSETKTTGYVKGVSHVAYKCADLNESIRFYRDVLGAEYRFELTYKEWLTFLKKQRDEQGKAIDPGYQATLEKLQGETWITYMTLGDQFIELFNAEFTTERALTDGKLNFQHLALEVDDILAFTEKIRALGAPIDVEPSLGLEHTWQMWSHDPDGNKIEFMQYTENSCQLVGKNGPLF